MEGSPRVGPHNPAKNSPHLPAPVIALIEHMQNDTAVTLSWEVSGDIYCTHLILAWRTAGTCRLDKYSGCSKRNGPDPARTSSPLTSVVDRPNPGQSGIAANISAIKKRGGNTASRSPVVTCSAMVAPTCDTAKKDELAGFSLPEGFIRCIQTPPAESVEQDVRLVTSSGHSTNGYSKPGGHVRKTRDVGAQCRLVISSPCISESRFQGRMTETDGRTFGQHRPLRTPPEHFPSRHQRGRLLHTFSSSGSSDSESNSLNGSLHLNLPHEDEGEHDRSFQFDISDEETAFTTGNKSQCLNGMGLVLDKTNRKTESFDGDISANGVDDNFKETRYQETPVAADIPTTPTTTNNQLVSVDFRGAWGSNFKEPPIATPNGGECLAGSSEHLRLLKESRHSRYHYDCVAGDMSSGVLTSNSKADLGGGREDTLPNQSDKCLKTEKYTPTVLDQTRNNETYRQYSVHYDHGAEKRVPLDESTHILMGTQRNNGSTHIAMGSNHRNRAVSRRSDHTQCESSDLRARREVKPDRPAKEGETKLGSKLMFTNIHQPTGCIRSLRRRTNQGNKEGSDVINNTRGETLPRMGENYITKTIEMPGGQECIDNPEEGFECGRMTPNLATPHTTGSTQATGTDSNIRASIDLAPVEINSADINTGFSGIYRSKYGVESSVNFTREATVSLVTKPDETVNVQRSPGAFQKGVVRQNNCTVIHRTVCCQTDLNPFAEDELIYHGLWEVMNRHGGTLTFDKVVVDWTTLKALRARVGQLCVLYLVSSGLAHFVTPRFGWEYARHADVVNKSEPISEVSVIDTPADQWYKNEIEEMTRQTTLHIKGYLRNIVGVL